MLNKKGGRFLVVKNRRGVSELIGYLMLVTFTVIIAAIVFVWLRSYVPSDSLQCPEGTSVFIKESSFDDVTNEFRLVLKNNGRFDVAGFFIHAANTEAETGTLDLSEYSTGGGTKFGNSIIYVPGGNAMSPGDTKTVTFDISVSDIGTPLSVDVVPVRYQVEDNRERFVSCSSAKVGSKVTEPGVVVEPPAQCSDGLDNDGDTCSDLDDDDCTSGLDTSESGTTCSTCTPSTELCSDSLDNDCDGDIDCLDAGCSSDPACVTPPECSDGIDNDVNGCLDFPADSGCADANDADESGGICTGSGSGTELNYFGFEDGAQGWTDPGANAQRSNDRSKKNDAGVDGGIWAWEINHDKASSYTAETFNFAAYGQIKIEWWGYYTSLDSGQNDCMEIRIDNVKVEGWGSNAGCGNLITQDTWIAQEVTMSSVDYTFDSSVEVRFETEMNNGDDTFYLDGVRITGFE